MKDVRQYTIDFNKLLIELDLPEYRKKGKPYKSEERYFHELKFKNYEIRFSITIWDVAHYFNWIGKYFDIDEIFIEDVYSADSADIIKANIIREQRDLPLNLYGVKELIYHEEDNSAFINLVYRDIGDTSWVILVKKLSKETFILLDLASSAHNIIEIKKVGFSILESIKLGENIK